MLPLSRESIPTPPFELRFSRSFLLSFAYVGSLRSFLALHDLELNGIALLQAFVTFRTDGAVVDEHVRPVVSSNKAVSFGVVEPLHSTFQTIHVRPLQKCSDANTFRKFAAIVRLVTGGVKTENNLYSWGNTYIT